jgi:predicted nuclease of predicted toxin-antitoxin system
VKLLFDQNLSPRLAKRLADLFPGSQHVDPLGLGSVPDHQVWDYAEANEFAVVTKDEDFSDLSVVRGSPPKVIWLVTGNCTTARVEALLRSRAAEIVAFGADPDAGVLAIA